MQLTSSQLILLSLAVVLLICIFQKSRCTKREGMTGYGTISGLAYNNRARYLFSNPDDPDAVYSTVIGRVTI